MNGLTVGGRYLLGPIIGRGRGSTVYQAMDIQINYRAAVKLLVDDIALTPEFGADFTARVYPFARLAHDHLLRLADFGLNGNMPYIVTPLLEQPNLEARLTTSGPLPPAEAALVVRDLALALDYMNGQGLTHLEVRPSNIWWLNGSAFLTDFYIAAMRDKMDAIRLQKGHTIEGYLRQPCPELFRGEPLTAASDQYGLAATLYRLLTGVLPYNQPTTNENGEYFRWLEIYRDSPPPDPRHYKPELSKESADVILRALSPRAGERFGSCAEFAEAFARSLQTASFSSIQPPISPVNIAPPAPPVYVAPPPVYPSINPPPPPVYPASNQYQPPAVYPAVNQYPQQQPPVPAYPYINQYQPPAPPPPSQPEQLEVTMVAPKLPVIDTLHPPPLPVETPAPAETPGQVAPSEPATPPQPAAEPEISDELVEPLPLPAIDNYTVIEALNSIAGSHALTLLAKVGKDGREVVLEYVGETEELHPVAEAKYDFLYQKVRASLSLRHTGILQPFDLISQSNRESMQAAGVTVEPSTENYVVFPRLTGQTLRERLQEVGNGPVPIPEAYYVLSQLAPALDFAHWCGVEHGRVNPDDIVRDERNLVVLRNFGIERLREHLFSQADGQAVHFNSHYCSPEEWQPQMDMMPDPTIRLGVIDQYSLGLILYEMLTGRQPLKLNGFFSPSWASIPDLRSFNPAIPPALAGVFARALAFDWRIRFGSIAEFAAAFRQAGRL